MSGGTGDATHAHRAELEEIRALARPLETVSGHLDGLVELCAPARFVCLGEASHGTQEYYQWRAGLSRRLIEEHRFSWIGVEGVDVYSLWDSLREIFGWLDANAPDAVPAALRAWQCFVPFREDPQRYAASTRLVPQSCEADVVALLAEVHRQAFGRVEDDPAAFDAVQNAIVAANAERYYRTMIRGDQQSWNIRDHHMSDTIDRLARHHGPGSKGLVWAHNTHIGDARATDMALDGMVNIGQLMRRRHPGSVVLIGFASYQGSVTAAPSWGSPEQVMNVPEALPGSHEDLLHAALQSPSALLFGADRGSHWLSSWRGHRAIGVVYTPHREGGN